MGEKKTKEKEEEIQLSTTWTLAYFSTELKEKVGAPTWSAIEKWNGGHFERMKAQAVWHARADLWSRFVAK